MARKCMITGLLLSLAFLLGTTAAAASEITLTSNYELTLQIQLFPTGDPAIPASGTISSYVTGSADYNPSETVSDDGGGDISAPGTVTANASGTWLKTMTASIDATDLGAPSFSSNLQGWGPQPEDPGDPSSTGNIFPFSRNQYDWSFTAPADGIYAVLVSGDYTIHFQLEQEAGSSYPLRRLLAYSNVLLSISHPGGSGTTEQHPFSYDESNYPEFIPLPDVTLDLANTLSFGLLFSVQEGETVTGSLRTYDAFTGTSIVPLPSSLFLLGSGLAGVLALRRRRRRTG